MYKRSCQRGLKLGAPHPAAVSHPGFLAHSHVRSPGTGQAAGSSSFPVSRGEHLRLSSCSRSFLGCISLSILNQHRPLRKKNQEGLNPHPAGPAAGGGDRGRFFSRHRPTPPRRQRAQAVTAPGCGCRRRCRPCPRAFSPAFPLPGRGTPNLRTLSS